MNILLTNSISHLLRKNDESVTAYLWYKHVSASAATTMG